MLTLQCLNNGAIYDSEINKEESFFSQILRIRLTFIVPKPFHIYNNNRIESSNTYIPESLKNHLINEIVTNEKSHV